MEKEEKILIARMVICGVLFGLSFFAFLGDLGKLIVSIVAFVIISYDILIDLVVGIFKKEFESEKFLMLIASIGAFAILEYHEAVAVMLLYQLGEFLQDLAVEKSKKSIVKLMNIRPDYANLVTDNDIQKVTPEEVKVGDIIVIYAGEKVPLDGKIIEGSTTLDMMALSGESLPVEATEGETVLSGAVNLTSTIKVEVSKVYSESTVSKIIDLVENSENNKAKSENFISKFAKIYTPVVVLLAVIVAILPPLAFARDWTTWISRALMLLVISCPCALVLSIPLSFFAGIGGASRSGILIKGANHLEALASAELVAFDKTGTITKGSFAVTNFEAYSIDEQELFELAAYAEWESNHPIANSIKAAYGKNVNVKKIKNTKTFAGFGVKAKIDKFEVLVGNLALMQKFNIECNAPETPNTVVFVAKNNKYVGYIEISDEIKSTSKDAISNLNKLGITKTVMLSGDKTENVKQVAELVGISDYKAELLPEQKAEILISLKAQTKGKTVFVGDGINDAPVLKISDIGIAMGTLGSDVAIETADIALMDDDPNKISEAIKISKKTMKLVKENIAFTIAFKAVMLTLGVLGFATMWLSVFADVGVSLLAVLNSLRALKKSK